MVFLLDILGPQPMNWHVEQAQPVISEDGYELGEDVEIQSEDGGSFIRSILQKKNLIFSPFLAI